MALNTTLKLFIDIDRNVAYQAWNNFTQVPRPTFFHRDRPQLELHLVRSTGSGAFPMQDIGFQTGTVTVGVGRINAVPTSGNFHLTVGVNETAGLPYNATAAQVAAALNGLASVTAEGGVSVDLVGEVYRIKWTTYGNKSNISGRSSSLAPRSTVKIEVATQGSSTAHEIVYIHLVQDPAAQGNTFTALPAPAATFSSGVLTRPREAIGGSFTLALSNGSPALSATTGPIRFDATSLDIETAIETAVNAQAGWSAATATVTQLTATTFSVVVTATNTATSYALTVALGTSSLVGCSGVTGQLDFDSAQPFVYLDGAEQVETYLEVSFSDGTGRQTYLQTPCIIRGVVNN
jgi:hypothetical protein